MTAPEGVPITRGFEAVRTVEARDLALSAAKHEGQLDEARRAHKELVEELRKQYEACVKEKEQGHQNELCLVKANAEDAAERARQELERTDAERRALQDRIDRVGTLSIHDGSVTRTEMWNALVANIDHRELNRTLPATQTTLSRSEEHSVNRLLARIVTKTWTRKTCDFYKAVLKCLGPILNAPRVDTQRPGVELMDTHGQKDVLDGYAPDVSISTASHSKAMAHPRIEGLRGCRARNGDKPRPDIRLPQEGAEAAARAGPVIRRAVEPAAFDVFAAVAGSRPAAGRFQAQHPCRVQLPGKDYRRQMHQDGHLGGDQTRDRGSPADHVRRRPPGLVAGTGISRRARPLHCAISWPASPGCTGSVSSTATSASIIDFDCAIDISADEELEVVYGGGYIFCPPELVCDPEFDILRDTFRPRRRDDFQGFVLLVLQALVSGQVQGISVVQAGERRLEAVCGRGVGQRLGRLCDVGENGAGLYVSDPKGADEAGGPEEAGHTEKAGDTDKAGDTGEEDEEREKAEGLGFTSFCI
ncbi:hypothetical protein FN846DRAFT_890264 [Sphaerosporella brunnea]|uniref:Uncharacterized protein n=1 Tax=Sphaerosporella brunnea TaxID=1250544 RepID=A0A5J5EWP0_9PEZI|nr:hypothetical protein FN846DRAFT_890264 [Sphaerosporella brunnea]